VAVRGDDVARAVEVGHVCEAVRAGGEAGPVGAAVLRGEAADGGALLVGEVEALRGDREHALNIAPRYRGVK
jgi:hypothetical protein